MAPMKRNRNRERKNTVARRRGKNASKKGRKYSGSSDGSRVEKRTRRKPNGYKLETAGIRSKRKYQRMGTGRYSKLARGGTRGSDDSRDKSGSGDIREKRYIREALKFGLAAGYLVPDENSGRQVLRVASAVMQLGGGGGGGGAERSGSEGGADGSSIEGRGRGKRSMGGGKRLNATRSAKTGQKNMRKRGRSRTKSPRKSAALKRRRKQSLSRTKTKARVQKRKRLVKAKSAEPATRKKAAVAVEGDADDDDEDEEEPDPDVDEDGNDNKDETKKLPVSSRPGSAVPDSDDPPPEGEKKGDDEPSDPSGEEATDDDEEEEEEAQEGEEAEEGLEAENANPGAEENKTEG